jgi:hypothetical protein
VVGLPLGSGDSIQKRSRGFLYRATCLQYIFASRLASPSRSRYYQQFTCYYYYYYRQLTSYSQVEGMGGRTTFASGELNQRLVQAHAHRAGLA